MVWYLQHHFNPDMNHLQLRPANGESTGSDLYNLGYVQNVITGQVLAQVIPLDAAQSPDPRFVLETPQLPQGTNTHIDPNHPTYLLASSNGYVFYLNGEITVKKMLNVRKDVSFETGNIFFVGDMAVHGSVRAGFEIQANNILIKEMVEGGTVRAQNNLAITGGARGGAGHHCVLDAGGTLRTSFTEKIETRARGNILIEKFCLYSTVYAGAHMVVQGRVYGGTLNVYNSMVINEQLGNTAAVPTRVFMGYDPTRIRHLEKIDKAIAALSETITHLTAIAGHLPPDTNDASRKLRSYRENREHHLRHREALWSQLQIDEKTLSRCQLHVRGKVFPGVEIAIGKAFLLIEKQMQNVIFRFENDDIVVEDAPTTRVGQKHGK